MSQSNCEIGFDALQTGDILLFKGNSWLDCAIEYLGRSPYSHVGIVLKNPTYIRPDLTGYYLLESGWEPFPDIDNRQPLGVQINRLEDVLERNKLQITYVRHLTAERNDNFYSNLTALYQQHQKDPYDLHVFDWIAAKILVDTNNPGLVNRLFGCWNNEQKTHTFWCSALVCFVFNRLGLLDDSSQVPWTIIAPRAWSSTQDNIVFRLRDCSLSSEKELRLI